jgi:hypothetical protein
VLRKKHAIGAAAMCGRDCAMRPPLLKILMMKQYLMGETTRRDRSFQAKPAITSLIHGEPSQSACAPTRKRLFAPQWGFAQANLRRCFSRRADIKKALNSMQRRNIDANRARTKYSYAWNFGR